MPTIRGSTVDGIGNEGQNSAVAEFAASRQGTQTPEGAGAAVVSRTALLAAISLYA